MIDTPILSSNELLKLLNDRGVKISNSELTSTIIKFSKIKGFGSLIEENHNDDVLYFLTQAQILMISSKFEPLVRWKLIKSLTSLTDNINIMENIVTASVDKRIHKYNENKNLIEVFRPLVNLLSPCYDNEFYAATHYQFTMLYNRMMNCNLTCYELKQLMAKHKFITKAHRAIPGGMIKESPHYIEYHDGSHDTVYSPMYTEENISLLLTALNVDNI